MKSLMSSRLCLYIFTKTTFHDYSQVGNVYVKFRREEDAEKAVKELNNRWFGGRPIYAELSPVTDFREACCRKSEQQFKTTPA